MSRIENVLEKAARMQAEKLQAVRPPENAEPTGESILLPKSPYIVTLTEPESRAAEQYRKLKAMVVKLTTRSAARNTIMITSCTSGEGKSITALNLAISLAQEMNHSALLIDADLRRPSLMEYLGITADSGLSDCLNEGISASSLVIRTGIPKVEILPAGTSVRNPGELLSSPKMKMMLTELKRQYADRYVIIDTPPILPFAETQVVSMLVDNVLLVVKEGAATVQEIQDALDLLKGSNVLGIAFNEVSAPLVSERYGSSSRYYAVHRQQKA